MNKEDNREQNLTDEEKKLEKLNEEIDILKKQRKELKDKNYDLQKQEEELQTKVDRLRSKEQKVEEIINGLKNILKEDTPRVRYILSELTRIQSQLHGSLNLVIPFVLSFLIVAVCYAFLAIKHYIELNGGSFTIALFTGIFFVFPVGYIWEFRLKRKEKELHDQIGKYRVTEELKDENDPDAFFRKLVQINFAHIDSYYRQTQVQANKSFWISLVCAIAAFGIIIYGIYLMNTSTKEFAYITTVSGILSEFIAAVFFYLYNQTIRSMGIYHQKLVLTQNVSLAIKVAQNLEGNEKAKAQNFIIEQLLKDINQQLVMHA